MAELAIQRGVPFSVPQPTPQQFGWDPNSINPSAAPGGTQVTSNNQAV
jgi:hypothetical protein